MKKLIVSLLSIFFSILVFASYTFAESASVEMSVVVAARKPTDTINDFDFSSISTANASGSVKGASTGNADSQGNNRTLIIELELLIISLLSLLFFAIKRYRRNRTLRQSVLLLD